MLRPCGKVILQTEGPWLVETLIEVALERAVASASSLHLLHEDPELFAILAIDLVIDGYGDRPLVMVRSDGEIVK